MALSIEVWQKGRGRNPRVWNAAHGLLRVPSAWGFLPVGNAALTRTVKKLGPVWTRVRGARGSDHTQTVGYYVPIENIVKAQALLAEQGKAFVLPAPKPRPKRRKAKPKPPRKPKKPAMSRQERLARRRRAYRVKQRKEEAVYRNQFHSAVVNWLKFAPEHRKLAGKIAKAATHRACKVGSGAVGRNKQLPMEAKAKRAALSHIRHHCTEYDRELSRAQNLNSGKGKNFQKAYSTIKKNAAEQARQFVERHRKGGGD